MYGDVFIEHMVARRPTPLTRLIQVSVWLAVLVLTALSLLFLLDPTVTALSLAGGSWGAWALFVRQHVEYEYILTNGELDVDRITGRRWRKRLSTVDCRKFDILAPVAPEFAAEMNAGGIERRLDATASPHAEDRWFALFHDKEGRRTLLLFQPDQRMLDAFKPLLPRKMKTK